LNFKNNLEEIEKINSSQEHYKAGLNRFSDLSKEEFVAKYTMRNRVSNTKRMNLPEQVSENLSQSTIPEAYDVRTVVPAGKKPIVKNQLDCGSCYSFAATTVMEYAQALSKDPKKQYTGPLSPQEFVDCSAVSYKIAL
jgi:C1A family cysteine protease